MIITVTPNPSVDISYPVNGFEIDGVNRVSQAYKTAGGKGLNVARVLKLLDEDVAASGFLGGPLGQWIEEKLKADGIHPIFKKISGETRNCISILHDGKQTEILEKGPTVAKEDVVGLFRQLKPFAERTKVLTMSGSLPPGVPYDFYLRLMTVFQEQHVPCIVDTSGDTLLETLSHEIKPFAIKPNEEELEKLLGEKLKVEAIPQRIMASSLKTIPIILVSLGARGALAKWEKVWYRLSVPTIKTASPVGSGDATVAGLAKGIAEKKGPEESLKLAMACGVLNAMEQRTGYMDSTKLQPMIERIHLKKLEV